MRLACRCPQCITPPHLLLKLMQSADKDIRQAALNTFLATSNLRGKRSLRASLAFAATPGDGRRTISDSAGGTDLSAARVARSEDGPESSDASVNRAFDGFGTTREFYKRVLDRNSLDNRGMRLDGFVHYDQSFNNAFWDGQEMIFGDGDGIMFTDLTKSLDVIAHELTHGVTQFTAGLAYHDESGALNESISDVFGSLVKQWSLNQTADAADWLIGAEVFAPGIGGQALRSMKAPGTAYNNDQLGKDPQPDHMNKYVNLPDNPAGDHGGVHINSGIPNKAFYLTAAAIGGYAWEKAGHIWYESLKASTPDAQFQDFADTTFFKADQLYGSGGAEQQAVASAWREVGVKISGGRATALARARAPRSGAAREDDSYAALKAQISELSQQVAALSRAVDGLKARR
ncbi:MAG: M4 family metallopeptidase [Methylocystis sp.]